jgi:hypothetical protein
MDFVQNLIKSWHPLHEELLSTYLHSAAVGTTPTLPLVVGFFKLSVFLSCPTP